MSYKISESELFLNPDNSVYHLNLRPENLADTVITVGDPDRVGLVSKYFDRIDFKTQKREFVTHTGELNGKRLTVLSTGIGTDNLDIVLNELDALVNVDLAERCFKSNPQSLQIIRIGTTGSLQGDIPIDAIVVSHYGVGLDGLLGFYSYEMTSKEQQLLTAFQQQCSNVPNVYPYAIAASPLLINKLKHLGVPGITVTCGGFYGPQGRKLRGKIRAPHLLDQLARFQSPLGRLTNFEMETAGLYGMGKVLNHHCCSLNVVIANRVTQQFAKNTPAVLEKLVQNALETLTKK